MRRQSWEGWRCGGAAAHRTPDTDTELLLVQILIFILLSWLTAPCQQGCRGIPQLPTFIIFNNFSFLVFIFCAHLVNTSGMLLGAGWPTSPGKQGHAALPNPHAGGAALGQSFPIGTAMCLGAPDVVQTEPQHQLVPTVPHEEQL